MPPKRSGRIEKARKDRLGGIHHKNHRWESFSTKIARLGSLQQLRKVRRHDLDAEDLSTSTSYFQNGLQKWGELNLSKQFCAFKTAVLPLSESLPQIIHHEDKIVQLLAQYISLHEKNALEPLLDILTALAHDLGVRFEKHFSASLGLLLAIFEKPQDAEVIEWSFGAMAFLFKYLSKLLAPDLRPTFDVLRPLLGRSRQPPHIARFAAEAMSFLVRKAAAPSHRPAALLSFFEHVRADLRNAAESRQFTLYNDGLMTMFSEAAKGTDGTIHSAGGAVITTLIDTIPDEECGLNRDSYWVYLVCGVLTSTLHHANADNFESLAEEIFDKIQSKRKVMEDAAKKWQTAPLIKILGVLAGVRKGTRVRNWDRLIRELVSLLTITGGPTEDVWQPQHDIVWDSIMSRVAMILHHTPIDVLIPHLTPLLQSLTTEPLSKWYIPFCAYFCDLDQKQFESLFRGSFQK